MLPHSRIGRGTGSPCRGVGGDRGAAVDKRAGARERHAGRRLLRIELPEPLELGGDIDPGSLGLPGKHEEVLEFPECLFGGEGIDQPGVERRTRACRRRMVSGENGRAEFPVYEVRLRLGKRFPGIVDGGDLLGDATRGRGSRGGCTP